MHTVPDKMENIRTAGAYIEKVSAQKPDFVILPEMFCCPYQTENFPVYAEEEGGPAWQAMSGLAEKYQIYLIAGSMPERDADGNIFNTSYIFDRQGKQIGKHRKAHLFDINVKGGQYFRESDTLTPGDHATVFDTEFGKMGVMICYDIRFPEFARTMVLDGAKMIFVPAAFSIGNLVSVQEPLITRFICLDVLLPETHRQDIFPGDIPLCLIPGDKSGNSWMRKKAS